MSWPLRPIGEYVQKTFKWDPRKSSEVEEFQYIDLSSVDKDKKCIVPELVSWTLPSEAPSRARQLVKSGDILVATVRPNLNGVAIVDDEFNGATASTGYCILRPAPEKLDAKYLFYWVRTKAFIQSMMKQATGANYPAVSDSIIKNDLFPAPPLADQKRIAAILDKADQLRQKRQQTITLADDFLRSVFLDMFGDPVTNPKRWEVKDISDVCTDIVDCVNRTAPTVDYETPYKMIRTTNVRGYKLHLFDLKCVDKDIYEKWIRRLCPQKGDIIFTREAPAGEAGIIETNDLVFLGQRTMHFRPDKHLVKPAYLLYELMGGGIKQQIRKLSSGSTVTHLSVPECKKFKVRVPPIELQEAFETIKLKLESIKDVKRTANELPLFNSLCQKAFSGEL